VPNLFAKLKKTHLYQDPIEHIYASNIFDIKEYDKLYENQNNPNHKVWKDFQTTYNFKKIRFFNDLNNVELDETILCLWFFKDRSDRNKGKDIKIKDKTILYLPNTFFILYNSCQNNIKILKRDTMVPTRPCLQLYFDYETYDNICQHIKKN
tara:strand:+ start:77 stop:532 length:456 start_codon:yes stop_codon:yes gene_type:complete